MVMKRTVMVNNSININKTNIHLSGLKQPFLRQNKSNRSSFRTKATVLQSGPLVLTEEGCISPDLRTDALVLTEERLP
jgi:hypothetical protein